MVSKRDQAICQRFRIIREVLGFSQGDVAKALQVSRERIASYEHARAPLRFDFADVFCATFYVNQHWLATGEGLITPYVEKPKGFRVPDRALFSAVYEETLKESVLAETAAHWTRIAPPAGATDGTGRGRTIITNEHRDRSRAIIRGFVDDWLQDTPDEFLDELTNRVWATGEAITRDILNEKMRVTMTRKNKA